MLHPNNLDSYLASEIESERCKVVASLIKDNHQSAGRAGWHLLAMSPSRLEKVSLATSLNLPEFPDALWTLCSYLLRDSEQDVVGNAINAMTHSRVRSFAHRSFHYLHSPERPQRVLYCLARYCEEAHDGRIAEHLAPTLASDLSDAFLARTFNALYRHGIRSNSALQVARELLISHVDATNMDRKAAVSALTYLFFAGDQEIIDELKVLSKKVSIPELRRLLNWGLREIDHLRIDNGSAQSKLCARRFWSENLGDSEPNFTGYGCFADSELLAALKETIEDAASLSIEDITRTILKTGNRVCIEWLSKHPHLGIKNNISSQSLREYWRQLCPTDISGMTEQLQDPQSALLWLQDSPEALVIHASEPLLKAIEKRKNEWISIVRNSDSRTSLNVLLGVILAAEYLVSNQAVNVDSCVPFLSDVLIELGELTQRKNEHNLITTSILSCLIGSTLELKEIESLRWKLMGDINWSHIALTHLHPNLENLSIQTMECFENVARNINTEPLSDEQILDLSRTTALALLSSDSVVTCDVAQKILHFESCLNFLDPNSNVEGIGHPRGDDSDDGEEVDIAATDWSGHVVVDHPVARWGTILTAINLKEIETYCSVSQAKKDEIETRLKEAMGTAKHVEKRWIARALACLGTDEAIKALLYQGLQHIDSEFVSHVIRELLPSSHPRAQQALIRCVGRNAISDELKLSILDEISNHNPQEVLQELRTLEILRLPSHIDDAVRDAVGRVAALLDEKETENSGSLVSNVVDLSGQDVDATIRSQLTLCDALTVDARSALRTAEMILLQSRSWTQSGMDLSPIVNMHFKAVELVLRDTFEPFTDALLRRGQISRKLDILGYARPIPEKMQIFEDFLANLPVVKTIPYFSKFKLRKMLRGVCLYRPGKRFTLDGPKAFALFFLVTSRLSCQFGLEKMLPLGFSTDVELFEYIKLIHSLQDSRNRAVHEGLTWDAKDDIESMRAQAFKVIDLTLRIKQRSVAPQEMQDGTKKNGLGVGA